MFHQKRLNVFQLDFITVHKVEKPVCRKSIKRVDYFPTHFAYWITQMCCWNARWLCTTVTGLTGWLHLITTRGRLKRIRMEKKTLKEKAKMTCGHIEQWWRQTSYVSPFDKTDNVTWTDDGSEVDAGRRLGRCYDDLLLTAAPKHHSGGQHKSFITIIHSVCVQLLGSLTPSAST